MQVFWITMNDFFKSTKISTLWHSKLNTTIGKVTGKVRIAIGILTH